MIQRKQTIFLILAVIALLACLCLPIGSADAAQMGVSQKWGNLLVIDELGNGFNFVHFADLVVTTILSGVAIFMYKKRLLQARLCTISIVMLLVWYAYYAYIALVKVGGQDGLTWHVAFGACLPLVAIVLLFMARAGIMADERLVKSMDRIR